MTRIKICCITSPEEARQATNAGADALGFVSNMPSGPGIISEQKIKRIIPQLNPFIIPVLLTCENIPKNLVNQYRYCRPAAIQLCEPLTIPNLQILRRKLPGVTLIHVIHVKDNKAIKEAEDYASLADAFLLDTGQRSGLKKQLGGTGQVHDWSLSTIIVQTCAKPVILAGGLKIENVAEAIKTVRPYAVDVCSGVRSNNKLDQTKLYSFIDAVKKANL